MDLFDVLRACARRWYILLPLLLIVAWASYDKYTAAQPVYYAQTVVGFAGPSARVEYAQAGVPVARNGLLDVGGASLLANMTALSLREPAVVDAVVSADGLADYTAKMFPTPSGTGPIPMVMVEVTNPDPTAVTRTLELLVAQTTDAVAKLQQQARVPQDQMATAVLVTPPTTPSAAMPSRTRTTMTIFVAGAGLTVLATLVADTVLGRLTARRRRRSTTAAGVSTEPTADAEPTSATLPEQSVEPK